MKFVKNKLYLVLVNLYLDVVFETYLIRSKMNYDIGNKLHVTYKTVTCVK